MATSTDPLTDPVVRFCTAFRNGWNSSDLDRVRSLLDDDLYAESHRTFTALGTVLGPDAHDAVLSFHRYSPHCDLDVVATRPHGHAAARWLLDDGGVGQLEIPLVIQIVEGRLVRCATFDAGELASALQLLSEWAPVT